MPKTHWSAQALTLTPEQLDAIMSEVNPASRAVLSVCRFTAARITEALSLKWENVTPYGYRNTQSGHQKEDEDANDSNESEA